jgi:hypothetical protein
MTQPPSGGQPPAAWGTPGDDRDGAGAGWSTGATPGPTPAPAPGRQEPPGWGQPAAPGWGQSPAVGWGTGGGGWTAPVQAQAGVVPLRPLGVGEILDGSFQAVRANPRSMIGTSAAVVAAVTLLSVVPQALLLGRLGGDLEPAEPGASVREQLATVGAAFDAAILPTVLTFFAVTVLNAMLIVPVSAAVLGRKVGPAEMWRRARGRVLPAVGLALLTFVTLLLGAVLVFLPLGLALLARQDVLAAVFGVAGFAALVVLLFVVPTRWALAAPALVLEKAPVVTSLRRSWRLTRGSFWRVWGILFLTGLIVAIGQAAISAPFNALASLFGVGGDAYADLPRVFGRLLLGGVGTIVSGAIFYPFNAAASCLLYIDLRMRREALDVRLAQAVAQGGPMP